MSRCEIWIKGPRHFSYIIGHFLFNIWLRVLVPVLQNENQLGSKLDLVAEMAK